MKRSIAEGLDATGTDDIRKAILGAKISAMYDGDLTSAERSAILRGLDAALDSLYTTVVKPSCNLGPNGGPCDPENERRV